MVSFGHIHMFMVRSNQQTSLLTDKIDAVSPRSTQTAKAPSRIPILPVRVTRERSREAVPIVLFTKCVVTVFGCQRCTEIDSFRWASIMIIVSTVWDGSAGLVYGAPNIVIRRNWGKEVRGITTFVWILI